MKITHLLVETAASNKLLKVLNGSEFNRVDNYYVFIWTGAEVTKLAKAGLESANKVKQHSPQGQIGIGIVDVNTEEICLGDISEDGGEFKAFWASSLDNPSDFFRAAMEDNIAKIKNFPSRLQYLANKFESLNKIENGSEDKITSTGVQKIVDTLNSNEDYSSLANSFEFDTDDVQEAKRQIEHTLRHTKKQIAHTEKQVSKLESMLADPHIGEKMSEDELEGLLDEYNSLGGNKLTFMKDAVDQMTKFLRVESDLFDPSTNDETDSDSDVDASAESSEKIESDIKDWEEDFNSSFPKLKVDAMKFYPGYED